MREIKFRAWLTLSGYDKDGNDKDYYAMAKEISVHHDGDIGFSVDYGNYIFGDDIFEQALANGIANEYEDWCLWESPFVLMQYTGLKDENGVEIFEGDILEIENWYSTKARAISIYKTVIGTIEYDPPRFRILPLDSANNDEYDIVWNANDEFHDGNAHYKTGLMSWVKVIGNIYENLELLEAK